MLCITDGLAQAVSVGADAMQGTEVSLAGMLECRERRAALQARLLAEYRCPLVSFSMNIPGPVKTNREIRAAFERGKTTLLESLSQQNLLIRAQEESHRATGDELILAVAAPTAGGALHLKALTTQIEEEHPLGRLFDMDVIDDRGIKLSRPVFRKCLICGRQAQECARSRTHSVAELQEAVKRLLILSAPR
ncbi:MAG: citrate lyase holo-[Fretibacterium sp.]|nr:citrate lyase holo-[acyl-carrier protein] synthase [Fretibacterium sp.]